MTSPFEDQAQAASEHLYKILHVEDLPVNEDPIPAWLTKMFDDILEHSAGTCEHLKDTPLQPMFVQYHEKRFRCIDCLNKFTDIKNLETMINRMRGMPTEVIEEEYKCDICRHFDPYRNWEPVFIMLGPVCLSFAMCDACEAHYGAELKLHNTGKDGDANEGQD